MHYYRCKLCGRPTEKDVCSRCQVILPDIRWSAFTERVPYPLIKDFRRRQREYENRRLCHA